MDINEWIKEQDQKVFFKGAKALQLRSEKCVNFHENYVQK